MLRRNKERKAREAAEMNKQVAGVLAYEKKYLEEIDGQLTKADDMEDPIAKLEELRKAESSTYDARKKVENSLTEIATKPTYRRTRKFMGITLAIGLPAIAVAAIASVAVPMLWIVPAFMTVWALGVEALAMPRMTIDTEVGKLQQKNEGLADFSDALNVRRDRASKALAETQENCDLKEVAVSLRSSGTSLKSFLRGYGKLSDRFDDALLNAAVGSATTEAGITQAATAAPAAKRFTA